MHWGDVGVCGCVGSVHVSVWGDVLCIGVMWVCVGASVVACVCVYGVCMCMLWVRLCVCAGVCAISWQGSYQGYQRLSS